MNYPAWRQQLARSLHLHRSKAEAKYFQVASISEEGLPKLRTMVFRGFRNDTNTLLAVTDTRSDKIRDWESLAKAELHWYFVKTREQYRISCDVKVVSWSDADNTKLHTEKSDKAHVGSSQKTQELSELQETYELAWQNLSANAQESFFCSAPKSPLSNETPISTGTIQPGRGISPHFALVCFIPKAVDYLDLKTTPHTRTLFSQYDAKWTSRSVNP